jgi:hypothetical protein
MSYGICPTCGQKVDRSAVQCMTCGRTDFKARRPEKWTTCAKCKGTLSETYTEYESIPGVVSIPRPKRRQCTLCKGKGGYYYAEEYDIRD